MSLARAGLGLVIALVFVAPLGAADDSRVIFPAAVAEHGADTLPHNPAPSFLTIGGIILLAAAGGFVLWKSKSGRMASPKQSRLVVDETKSLGNRQFLVVASYEGKKFLLGVCPGKIALLAPLSQPVEEEVQKFSL